MSKRERKRTIAWMAAGVIVMAVALGALWYWQPLVKRELPLGEKPTRNPLKGWMRWGENYEPDEDAALAYVRVTWGELEPIEGQYDFERLEREWHFDDWTAQGAHLVLRVVADTPGEAGHMDIPPWLYKAMDGAGTWYDGSYGAGFSPDYTHSAFRQAHARLLMALGERYNGDPRVAYVQLGSLGHWGEWHVNTDDGIAAFPTADITEEYARDYVEAFPNTPLMMRRPYGAVKQYGLGLYDDSFGNVESEERLLGWIAEGYVSDQNGEALPGCPDFWKTGVSGGEIASSVEMESFFANELPTALGYLQALHTTLLGPNAPRRDRLSEQAWANVERFSQEMGYCFTVRWLEVRRSPFGKWRVHIEMENLGVAPMYHDWAVRLEIREGRSVVYTADVAAKPSHWVTRGDIAHVMPALGQAQGERTLWVGLVDSMTGACRVALASDLPCEAGMYCLGEI